MGILSSAYGFDRQSAPIYSGRGKSFFITRLLRDVIFREAELAGLDPRVERKQKYIQWGALGSAATLAILSLIAWFTSYSSNSTLIGRVEQEAIAYHDLKPDSGADWSTRWQAELNRLAPLQNARDIYKDAGFFSHFGLFQGDKVTQATEIAYQAELTQNFLPLLMQLTAQRMTGPEASKQEVLYEMLRVYLMLSQPERMQAGLVRTWVTQDWEQGLRTQPDVLSHLISHLDHLLTLERGPTPVDPVLVANARARLTEIPRVMQLYLRFKDEIPKNSVTDLKLSEVLGPDASQVFSTTDGRPIANITVPALFTAQGYKDQFLGKSLEFFRAAITDNWVLGQDATPSPTELMRLYDDFRQLYLDEYRRVWSDLLAGLQPQPVQSLNQAIALLETLSKPNNSLVKLVETVSQNTALSHVTQVSAEAKPDDRTQRILEAAKAQVPALGHQTSGEQHLEAAFAGLHSLMQKSGDHPPPMDALLQTLEKLHDYLLRVASFAGGGEQALKKAEERMAATGEDVISEAKAAFSRLPEPLKSWLSPLATLGWKQVLSGARIELSAQLRTDVAAPCMAALPGRYPFDPSGTRDMPLIEFGKLFGPQGVLDQFVATRLKGLVDTSGSIWKPIVVDNQSMGFSPTTLKQFQTFCKIRDAFFSAGGPLPRVAFELKPVALDQRATSFKLALEGQELLFQPGAETPMTLQWPGEISGSGVKVVFQTQDGQEITNAKEGPWAFFKLLDESRLEATSQPERFNLTFQQNGYTAKYELRAGSALNPFNLDGLRGFNCPETL
jgi:type VI secretion system protein ImpL